MKILIFDTDFSPGEAIQGTHWRDLHSEKLECEAHKLGPEIHRAYHRFWHMIFQRFHKGHCLPPLLMLFEFHAVPEINYTDKRYYLLYHSQMREI